MYSRHRVIFQYVYRKVMRVYMKTKRDEQQLFASYSFRLSEYLIRNGFDICGIVDDPKNDYFKFVLFKTSDELIKKVEKYKQMNKNKRS